MNDEIARHLARVAFSTSRELQATLSFLREQLSPEEYRNRAEPIASAIQGVMTALIDQPLAARPDLRAEIEASIARYGRYL